MAEIFWYFLTLFGDPAVLSLPVVGLFSLYFLLGKRHPMSARAKRDRRIIKTLLLLMVPSVIISFAGAELLKLAFQIPRTCIPCPAPGCSLYCPFTYSFPSGHTATITGFVTAIFLLRRKPKFILLYILPVLVGASRIALRVHTPADVLGGFIFGLCATLVVWRFRKRLYRWEEEIL